MGGLEVLSKCEGFHVGEEDAFWGFTGRGSGGGGGESEDEEVDVNGKMHSSFER